MKYMMLIYSDPETWGHPSYLRTREVLAMSEGERDELTGRFDELLKEIAESGEMVGGEALADPGTTRTVRVRAGVPAVADGPYVEAEERLAGFFVVDCESPERAAEIAARVPEARYAAVEVRPIMEMSGQEM